MNIENKALQMGSPEKSERDYRAEEAERLAEWRALLQQRLDEVVELRERLARLEAFERGELGS